MVEKLTRMFARLAGAEGEAPAYARPAAGNSAPALQPLLWLAAGAIFSLVVAREGFSLMTNIWFTRPEYSHGVLIPLIAGYLIWQRRHDIAARGFNGNWLGLGAVVLGLALWLIGRITTIFAVSQYALVIMFYGLALALVGAKSFAKLWPPMLMLLLMIPLPYFFYYNLSSELQLVSSAFGVWLMRLVGISVYLSGNVIDLGSFQMQVAEACDGLRYLFPLMTLGFIIAYFFRAPLWQRLLVFLSSVPLTIFMNSLRIAMIGVFADHGNTSLAEGLLHQLQGWVIFMASGALLLAETWVLARLFIRDKRWHELLRMTAPTDEEGWERPVVAARRPVPSSLITAVLVLGAAAVLSYVLPHRAESRPDRQWFVDFPMTIGGWQGQRGRIEDMYLDRLKLDDYLMADYKKGPNVINLYSAYYASQRQGEAVHSPRSCLPGGGWRVTSFGQVEIPGDERVEGFRVNRAVIALGSQREVVYYWFKERDRHLTNEYVVKWYIVVDALVRHRTDGALIRLVTPLAPGEDPGAADARLQTFARQASAALRPYLPD